MSQLELRKVLTLAAPPRPPTAAAATGRVAPLARAPASDPGQPAYDEGPMPRSEFMQACASGDVAAVRDWLGAEPGLASARDEGGLTGLHLAIRHPETMRLLL